MFLFPSRHSVGICFYRPSAGPFASGPTRKSTAGAVTKGIPVRPPQTPTLVGEGTSPLAEPAEYRLVCITGKDPNRPGVEIPLVRLRQVDYNHIEAI
jgi:hypothetical protein